jgi:hypothetical protein
MGHWRKKAKEIIGAALIEGKASGVRGRALRRFITKKYPEYGHPRSKYPYRVWLQELDAVMYRELNGCSQIILNLESLSDQALG